MGSELVVAGTVDLLLHLAYSFIAVLIATEILIFFDKRVFKELNFQKEINNGNIAVAIFASVIMLFAGAIIGSSMAIAI